MKKRAKKVLSVLASASLVLSVAVACTGTEEIDSGDGGPGGPKPGESEAVQQRAEELKDHEALPDVEVTEKLKLLRWFEMDETSPTAELFKARYGIPDEANGENVVTYLSTTYENRYTRLASLIMAGDSPDFFQFEERGFPYGVYIDQFSPIDDVIDLSGPEWDPTRDVIELFNWGGKNYTAITELNNSSALLYYRKSVVQEAGLEDPYDLWQRNDWTWDTLRRMVTDFSDPANNKYGIVGYYIDEATILSTGTGLISIENGMLKNNMDDSRIERALDFLQELAVNDFRYPYDVLSQHQIGPQPFRSGNILFWNDGPWRYQETLAPIGEADQWAEDEVGIVPFPRDPQANEFFHRGKQDALMLVAGSQNKDGFKAWTQASIVANYDEVMMQIGREKAMSDYKWTPKHLDILEAIRKLTPVWDFKNGIGPDVSDATIDSPVENLTKPVIMTGASYTQLRGENSGPIIARIAEINATVSQN
ncbi:MAG: extracellular solute-binding protein [Oscillospiraceae bacterium]|nr:extracellular solute-binding protein [Oscillospiraceae bacterium]